METMPKVLKAIPTRYAGYKFRSRLEARWATAFDALDIEWEYEPQGYDLASGSYLPDFRFPTPTNRNPEDCAWLDIKPRHPSPDELQDVRNHLREIAIERGDRSFVINGDPGRFIYEEFVSRTDSWQMPDLSTVDGAIRGEHINAALWLMFFVRVVTGEHRSLRQIVQAINAGRSAQFEHGERATPRPEDLPSSRSMPSGWDQMSEGQKMAEIQAMLDKKRKELGITPYKRLTE